MTASFETFETVRTQSLRFGEKLLFRDVGREDGWGDRARVVDVV
jgi:hypothetical protein